VDGFRSAPRLSGWTFEVAMGTSTDATGADAALSKPHRALFFALIRVSPQKLKERRAGWGAKDVREYGPGDHRDASGQILRAGDMRDGRRKPRRGARKAVQAKARISLF